MARVYKRKPDAKRDRITIPATAEMLERLRAFAARIGVTRTEAARLLIEKGLKKERAHGLRAES